MSPCIFLGLSCTTASIQTPAANALYLKANSKHFKWKKAPATTTKSDEQMPPAVLGHPNAPKLVVLARVTSLAPATPEAVSLSKLLHLLHRSCFFLLHFKTKFTGHETTTKSKQSIKNSPAITCEYA